MMLIDAHPPVAGMVIGAAACVERDHPLSQTSRLALDTDKRSVRLFDHVVVADVLSEGNEDVLAGLDQATQDHCLRGITDDLGVRSPNVLRAPPLLASRRRRSGRNYEEALATSHAEQAS